MHVKSVMNVCPHIVYECLVHTAGRSAGIWVEFITKSIVFIDKNKNKKFYFDLQMR